MSCLQFHEMGSGIYLLHTAHILRESAEWATVHIRCWKQGKMGESKFLSDFDRGKILRLEEWVRASPKLHVLWGVTSLQ